MTDSNDLATLNNSSDSEEERKAKKKAARERRKVREMNRAVPKLPRNKLVILKNSEKDGGWYENWEYPKNRSLGCLPHPFRLIASGSVGRGKTLTIKNLILQHQSGKKKFKKLYICTCSLDSTEYLDMEPTGLMTTLPEPDMFDGSEKCCLVIDDYETEASNKAELRKMATLFRYTSTHRNLSIICSYQSFVNIPSIARKCANTFLIYKPRSKLDLTTIANRCGIEKENIKSIFKTVCNGNYDSLMIDHSVGSPAPLRKNVFEKIIMADSDSDDE